MWPGAHAEVHRERLERLSVAFARSLPPSQPAAASVPVGGTKAQQAAAAAHAAASAHLAPAPLGSQRRALRGHTRAVDGLAWNCTGTRLASCGRDHGVRVWTIDTKRDLATQTIECIELKGHTNEVDKCHWHPTNPDWLATCSADKSVRWWNLAATPAAPAAAAPTAIATSATAPALPASIYQVFSLTTPGENIHLRWSPCGRYIGVCNNNNVVSIVSVDTTARKLVTLKTHGFTMDINAIEWDKLGERILLGYERGTIEVVQVPGLNTIASIPCHSTSIFNVVFDPKYKYLATGAADGVVNLFTTQDFVCVRSFTRLDDSIRAVSFSGDSQLIACGGKDARIEISDVESGARVHLFPTADETLALAFHPRAHILAYATGDKKHPGEVHLISAVAVASATPPASQPAATTANASVKQEASNRPAAGRHPHPRHDQRKKSPARVKAEPHAKPAPMQTD